MEHIETKEVSKIVRGYMKEHYPNLKCWVRSKYFSMGSSIEVWIEYDESKDFDANYRIKGEVGKELNQFRGYRTSSNPYEDGMEAIPDSPYGNMFISVHLKHKAEKI